MDHNGNNGNTYDSDHDETLRFGFEKHSEPQGWLSRPGTRSRLKAPSLKVWVQLPGRGTTRGTPTVQFNAHRSLTVNRRILVIVLLIAIGAIATLRRRQPSSSTVSLHEEAPPAVQVSRPTSRSNHDRLT